MTTTRLTFAQPPVPPAARTFPGVDGHVTGCACTGCRRARDPLCYGCYSRVDRSPLAGGCGCARPIRAEDECDTCGRDLVYYGAESRTCWCPRPERPEQHWLAAGTAP